MSLKKVKNDYFERLNTKNYNNFDFFSNKQPLNTSNFPQHFFAIAALFAKDCNYHISNFDTQNGILSISGHYKGKGNELMLRFRHNGSLVVARIKFINQRKGYMTELFKIIKKVRRRYGLKSIVIESVHSDSMENWCKKNNFKASSIHPENYEKRFKTGNT